MFQEIGGAAAGSKKKKWIYIMAGTGLIAIFLIIRNSMQASQTAAVADPLPADPQITDTGSYPSDSFGGGISGTGMDQTLATYLAIADQNSTIQMDSLNKQLSVIQDQMNTNNSTLQSQITALNTAAAVSNVATTPQPVTTSTPDTTAHPNPNSITLVHSGTYQTPRGGWNPNSVVDHLKMAGAAADMATRKQYAMEAGIQNYSGTAAQNVQLLSALKAQGK